MGVSFCPADWRLGPPGALHTRVPPDDQQTVLPNGVSSNGRDNTSEAADKHNGLFVTGRGQPEVTVPLRVAGDHSRGLHASGWETGEGGEFETVFLPNGV